MERVHRTFEIPYYPIPTVLGIVLNLLLGLFIDPVTWLVALAALTNDDSTNFAICMAAQRMADLEIDEIEGAPAAERTLSEVAFPRGSLIIADVRGGRIGGPETVLEPGERYLVAYESNVADEVMNLLRG